MTDTNGLFIWHELMTSNVAAARAFYESVVGWSAVESPVPHMPYWMFRAGEWPVAGLMAIPDDARAMGARPMWTGYIGVADVDASARRLESLGGALLRPPMDIPGVGRFAIVEDPFHAHFALFNLTEAMPGEPPSPMSPGLVGWNELYSDDAPRAFDFYAGLFGWRKDQPIDMGPMGTYQLFAMGDRVLGGMMTRPPNVPVSSWLYYFSVGEIDAAVDRAKKGHGEILHGPSEVPGGAWIAQGRDPQGAAFAVVGTKR
jgi:uncharacterized protein